MRMKENLKLSWEGGKHHFSSYLYVGMGTRVRHIPQVSLSALSFSILYFQYSTGNLHLKAICNRLCLNSKSKCSGNEREMRGIDLFQENPILCIFS